MFLYIYLKVTAVNTYDTLLNFHYLTQNGNLRQSTTQPKIVYVFLLNLWIG